MSEDSAFVHSAGFARGETSGDVRLGKLEMMYEELFAEVIEDGIITGEERARLDKAAESLGLDRDRLRRLELALQASWEAQHKVVIKEMFDDGGAPAASIEPLLPATDVRTLALQRRVRELEARVADLERELEQARAQAAVEVDVSGIAAASADDEDPAELQRRLRHAPRDVDSLHALFRAHERRGEADRQYCAAHVLVYLDAAGERERAFHDAHHPVGLLRPRMSLTAEAWIRLLAPPEQEPVTGDIFADIAPAILLGRISALRREKRLPALDPATRQAPETSTLQAVRCFAWAAAILGSTAPPLYADPSFPGTVELVPAVPPAARIGAAALSGRSAPELAFIAGRQLAYHRDQHIARVLVPTTADLEAVFLAALTIGNAGLPMNEKMKQLVTPIARAIEPILDPAAVDRLRAHFLRFVEEGGRTNLQRWVRCVDRTAARAGFLLAGDLRTAHKVLSTDAPEALEERMDDLIAFASSDRHARLRAELGIALA